MANLSTEHSSSTTAPTADSGMEFFQAPKDIHPATFNLVARFATALAEKLAAAELKYGYSDGWARPDWMDQCRQHLVEHISKGDPRDVAAYCAFLWYHGERTAALPDQQPAAKQDADWHSVIERALAKAVKADPSDAPFGLDPQQATIWHQASASAYQHALEMIPAKAAAPAPGVSEMHTAPPAPHGDAQDAERYRWLRDWSNGSLSVRRLDVLSSESKQLTWMTGNQLDLAIDAAIAAQAGEVR
ncbi:hypothetical protein [Pseudoxanthomonas sp. USHLN014]|uniref:hypothetical protein n=1 Tax=Pseudoxanthomonas sp. USHLN014 TaxID=3081297 RepID=UPI00301D7A25